MFCKCKSTRTGDHWSNLPVTKLVKCFLDQGRKSFSDIGKVSFIIGKKQVVMLIEYGNLYGSRTDINSKFQSVTPENPDNI